MIIDTSKLRTLTNFGKMKGISRQRIHILVNNGKFDTIKVDGLTFIILNEKSLKYKKRF